MTFSGAFGADHRGASFERNVRHIENMVVMCVSDEKKSAREIRASIAASSGIATSSHPYALRVSPGIGVSRSSRRAVVR